MALERAVDGERPRWLQPIVIAGLAITEAALLYKLIVGQVATGSTELIIAICVVGVLLLLTGRIDSIESISVGKRGITAKMERIERRTTYLEREVEDLVFLSMGDDAYKNLQKLATGQFLNYRMPELEGLETELYHLRNLGYIQLKEELQKTGGAIHRLERDGTNKNLCDYIEVTPRGKKYIELRESWVRTRE
jgi:hypothetical protein